MNDNVNICSVHDIFDLQIAICYIVKYYELIKNQGQSKETKVRLSSTY